MIIDVKKCKDLISQYLIMERANKVIRNAKADKTSEIYFLAEMEPNEARKWVLKAIRTSEIVIDKFLLVDVYSDIDKCLAYQRMIKESE